MPEYEYVNKLYSTLRNFFNTNNFSKVLIEKGDSGVILKSSEMNRLKSMPSVEKDGFTVSLWSINVKKTYDENLYSINIGIVIYEEKDPNKSAELKAAEAARVPKDCVGRDLMVGDTVAYSVRGIADGWDPLPVGIISKTGKEQIEVDNRKVYGYRCCLISRKDGKRIE